MRSAESNLKCSMIDSTRKRTIYEYFLDPGPILRVREFIQLLRQIYFIAQKKCVPISTNFASSTLRVRADTNTSPTFSNALTTVSSSLDYQPIVLLQFPEKDYNRGCHPKQKITWVYYLKSIMYFPARTVFGRISFWQKDTFQRGKMNILSDNAFFFLQSSKTV